MATLNEEMVASYTVAITGIQRTKSELAKLDNEIALLRAGGITIGGRSVTSVAARGVGGDKGLFVSIFEGRVEGRVQTSVQRTMVMAMDMGRKIQGDFLRAAVTQTGANRGRGNGPGRDDTGGMIRRIQRNVEVLKTTGETFVTGYHGWQAEGLYDEFQERGTRGRGGTSRRDSKGIYRAPNKIDRRRAGQKKNTNAGIPAANSLGQSIIPVREFLKRELAGIKR